MSTNSLVGLVWITRPQRLDDGAMFAQGDFAVCRVLPVHPTGTQKRHAELANQFRQSRRIIGRGDVQVEFLGSRDKPN